MRVGQRENAHRHDGGDDGIRQDILERPRNLQPLEVDRCRERQHEKDPPGRFDRGQGIGQHMGQNIGFRADHQRHDRHIRQRGDQRDFLAEGFQEIKPDAIDARPHSVQLGERGGSQCTQPTGNRNRDPGRVAREITGHLDDDEKRRRRECQPRACRHDRRQPDGALQTRRR